MVLDQPCPDVSVMWISLISSHHLMRWWWWDEMSWLCFLQVMFVANVCFTSGISYMSNKYLCQQLGLIWSWRSCGSAQLTFLVKMVYVCTGGKACVCMCSISHLESVRFCAENKLPLTVAKGCNRITELLCCDDETMCPVTLDCYFHEKYSMLTYAVVICKLSMQ